MLRPGTALSPDGAPAGAHPPDSGDVGILHRTQHIWSQRPLPAGGLTLPCYIPRTKSLVSPWLVVASQRTRGLSQCLGREGGRHQVLPGPLWGGGCLKARKSSLVTICLKSLSSNPLASHTSEPLPGPKGPVEVGGGPGRFSGTSQTPHNALLSAGLFSSAPRLLPLRTTPPTFNPISGPDTSSASDSGPEPRGEQ